MLLSAQSLKGGYGGGDILHDISIDVAENEIVAIIGPNGAGKSTAMKAIFGLVPLRKGKILFDGKDITGRSTDKLVADGIGYVPQERNVFCTLSVRENLEMGAFCKPENVARKIDEVLNLFPPLVPKLRQMAGDLSGGERQMVAMGRALMMELKLLLLDEPTAGLSPLYMDQIFERIRAIHQAGVSVLLVEQNARQALRVADRAYVLATGRNRMDGPANELLASPDIVQSFLGG